MEWTVFILFRAILWVIKIYCFRVEVNLWLNYLDDPVNILPHIYWLVFTLISGVRCNYFLYWDNIRYFLGGEMGCPISVISFVWGKLLIVFLYIWLWETDDSSLEFCFGSEIPVVFLEDWVEYKFICLIK